MSAVLTILPPTETAAPVSVDTLMRALGDNANADAGLQAWLADTASLLGNSDRLTTAEIMRLALAVAEARHIIALQQQQIDRLQNLSVTDELTGLYNRRGFASQLSSALEEARRNDSGGVLIYADVDSFKQINDCHGHAAGDLVLKKVSETLADRVRRHDSVARMGGDEFATLLTRTDSESGFARAHQLSRQLNRLTVTYNGAAIPVRVSVGVVAFGPNDTEATLMARADKEMYQNKQSNRRLALVE